MKQSLILVACFLPLAVIWLVMKLSLWLSSSVSEVNYVREDAKRPHGPYLENPYGDVDEEEEDS
jgi:hypothetical protein